MTSPPATRLDGLGISPGIAVGPVLFLEPDGEDVPRLHIEADQMDAEVTRFRQALRAAEEEFAAQQSSFAARFDGAESGIFDAHLQIYQDTFFRDSIEHHIRERLINAEAAVHDEIEAVAEKLAQADSLFQERVADFRDIGRRINRMLLRREQASLASGRDSFILYARELLPSETLGIDRNRLLAIVTEVGGAASHVAILARAFGIPAVTGVRHLETLISPGTEVAVNGSQGFCVVNPSSSQQQEFAAEREEFLEHRRQLALTSESQTSREREDGIQVLLNIENFDALDDRELRAAQGVGLYRTEFLFMRRATFPSEEEQADCYVELLQRMHGREITFRTIDVGGDKPLPYLSVPREQNPVLGWRGIRLAYQWPDLLIPQLRALLRASAHGPLQIMLPMVTCLEELRQVRQLFQRLRDDLEREQIPMASKVPLGVMIEVPAAALAAAELAAEADFLSIGTNDLVQYVFAADRNNLQVAHLYRPLHPAMLRLLDSVLEAARMRSCPVTVCGEMAGEPLAALVLLGLGLRRFSMSPSHTPEARAVFEHFRAAEAAALVKPLLALETEAEVQQVLRQALLAKVGSEASAWFAATT